MNPSQREHELRDWIVRKDNAGIALHLWIVGQVQGVGMRPALTQLALQHGITGWVRNAFTQVELWIEGDTVNVQAFETCLVELGRLPGRVEIKQKSTVPVIGYEGFRILRSEMHDLGESSELPLDRVVCGKCRDEFNDANNRRYRYPLIGCNSCGPRFSILKSMPFDREASVLNRFVMCEECEREYTNICDRRFHSQTNLCPRCGPQLHGLERGIEALQRGGVAALRGIGGYQWLAVASSESAVQLVRKLKGRPRKPLAVMIGHAELDNWVLDVSIRERLIEPDGAIVIVPSRELKRNAQELLAQSVLNEVSSVGLMLPTSMLHDMIVENVGPVVVTSANLDGEPMCVEASEVEALTREMLGTSLPLIDHNRPLYNRIDDSVVLARTNGFITVRPARGLTPKSWNLKKAGLNLNLEDRPTKVLGLGAEQKVCFAWSDGAQVTLGPYFGDLGSVAMQSAAMLQWDHLSAMMREKPTVVVHDNHPDFFTTQWAFALEVENSMRRHQVQHHRAHWLASLLEPGWLNRTAIGIVWDGTGLGEDGKIWGGEAFVGDCHRQKRVATLHTFGLPGGEAAIREPWRVAVSLLSQVNWNYAKQLFAAQPIGAVKTMLNQELHVTPASSTGRLFDGVAAMIMDATVGCRVVSYEGELAQLLEESCDESETGCYLIPLVDGDERTDAARYIWDWRPMIARIAEDKIAQLSSGRIAMRFHRALANAICELLRFFPGLPLTLSGGCFQNRVLLRLLQEAKVDAARSVAWPGIVPINDSGIALGQVIAALVQDVAVGSQGDVMTEIPEKCA